MSGRSALFPFSKTELLKISMKQYFGRGVIMTPIARSRSNRRSKIDWLLGKQPKVPWNHSHLWAGYNGTALLQYIEYSDPSVTAMLELRLLWVWWYGGRGHATPLFCADEEEQFCSLLFPRSGGIEVPLSKIVFLWHFLGTLNTRGWSYTHASHTA